MKTEQNRKFILGKAARWYFSEKALPYWCILFLDLLIVLFSGVLSRIIAIGAPAFAANFWPYMTGMVIVLAVYTIVFRLAHTYTGVLRYSSFVDLERVAIANSAAFVLCAIVKFGWSFAPAGAKAVVIVPGYFTAALMSAMTTILMWSVRVLVKTLYDVVRTDAKTQRVFVYGTRSGGVSIAKSIRNQEPKLYQLAGFVTTDPTAGKYWLMGNRVYREDEDIVSIMKAVRATILFVSPMQQEHFINERDNLVKDLLAAGIRIYMQPSAAAWDGKSEWSHQELHEVQIEDLLPREKIEVDMEAIGKLLRGTRILITGAAGSIGSEIVRQVAQFAPSDLILVDQAETPMHDVRLYMSKNFPQIQCETIVTSIAKKQRMEEIFAGHRPDFVFHAAAYKHVPMMEDNPSEAVQNNVYGTHVVADLAVKYGARKFVMISTDKAVNPTNVMGCSKRICEIYCQSLNKALEELRLKVGEGLDPFQAAEQIAGSQEAGSCLLQSDGTPGITQFVTTRFGNVLGSNGSVIPIFREQIKKGGPVTVTHPDIIRYFMLIPEACKLVLEAGTMGKGGEIFVFDMGKPVRIADLARKMIDLSHAQGVEIKFTGLRDGEKLYEEVLNDQEQTRPTVHPKIKVAAVREYPFSEAYVNEVTLYEESFGFDDMEIVRKMKQIVPEYRSKHSKYEALDV